MSKTAIGVEPTIAGLQPAALDHLAISPRSFISIMYILKWTLKGLNLRPLGYEPSALPIELKVQYSSSETRTHNRTIRSRVLYPLSYATIIVWTEMELNHRHEGLHSSALPTELSIRIHRVIRGTRTLISRVTV